MNVRQFKEAIQLVKRAKLKQGTIRGPMSLSKAFTI